MESVGSTQHGSESWSPVCRLRRWRSHQAGPRRRPSSLPSCLSGSHTSGACQCAHCPANSQVHTSAVDDGGLHTGKDPRKASPLIRPFAWSKSHPSSPLRTSSRIVLTKISADGRLTDTASTLMTGYLGRPSAGTLHHGLRPAPGPARVGLRHIKQGTYHIKSRKRTTRHAPTQRTFQLSRAPVPKYVLHSTPTLHIQ